LVNVEFKNSYYASINNIQFSEQLQVVIQLYYSNSIT